MRREIKIGCDLDGVVARHILGGIFVKIRVFKEKFLKKIHSKSYYYPQTKIEELAWIIINWWRVPDKEGVKLLKKFHSQGFYLFLITSRFKFNYPSTTKWLKKFSLFPLFTKVLVNVFDEDPINFKIKMVGQEKLDYFIDDDLEVLNALCQTEAKLYWVVPGHRNGDENGTQRIHNCQSLSDALTKISHQINLDMS